MRIIDETMQNIYTETNYNLQMNKEIVMAQSTQNIAKSTQPRKPSPSKQRYRRKRRRATLFAVILIAAVLLIAGFMIYSILFAKPNEKSNVSNISTEEIYNNVDVPLEIVTPEPEISITISVVGDCTLGTDENFNYARSLNAYYEKNGPEYFLKNVKSIFESDDLTIANLEGTFTDLTSRADKTYAFKGPKEFVNILTSSSVESVTLANNHSRDYGTQSLADTKATLDSAGVIHFGYDETSVVDVKGVKVGLIGIYELIDHTGRAKQVKDHIAKV